MKVQDLGFGGVKLILPQVFKDKRGFFLEQYKEERYMQAGIEEFFPQDNLSYSKFGVIRGMHFQVDPPQAKLIQVIHGEIYDVFVDINPESKNFGKWQGITLSDKEPKQLYLPSGFAHGFCCLSEDAYVLYKVSSPYDPSAERNFLYSDAEIGIKWPVEKPILSERDLSAPSFSSLFSIRKI